MGFANNQPGLFASRPAIPAPIPITPPPGRPGGRAGTRSHGGTPGYSWSVS